ncbi:MAG: hypothetical protein M3Z05_07095 [Gemmatimonadota bacterium]|nr:hypothetical protein [Gemmatimonadota bacterium]
MFVHAVYFWLRDGISREDEATFDTGVRAISSIEGVGHSYVGAPAV